MPSFLSNFFNLLLAIPPEFIEETEQMSYSIELSHCDEAELLDAKLECLRLAHSMINHETTSTDTIIANATKFWNFLTAEELPEFPSESGH